MPGCTSNANVNPIIYRHPFRVGGEAVDAEHIEVVLLANILYEGRADQPLLRPYFGAESFGEVVIVFLIIDLLIEVGLTGSTHVSGLLVKVVGLVLGELKVEFRVF